MLEILSLANIRILLALNHTLAADANLYKLAAILTNKGTDVAVVLTLGLLWFWPRRDTSLLSPAQLSPAGGERKGLGALLSRKGTSKIDVRHLVARQNSDLTTDESRAQLIVVGLALVTAYVTARLIGVEMNISRPFATYLPLREGDLSRGSFQALAKRSDGSFPSNHAVLLAALPVASFYWNRALGWSWAVFSALLIVIRVATGFHYPSDMLAGSLLGIFAVLAGMTLYRREGKFFRLANLLAQNFSLSNAPYCYILYFLALAVGAEVFINHLNGAMRVIFEVRGDLLYRLRGS